MDQGSMKLNKELIPHPSQQDYATNNFDHDFEDSVDIYKLISENRNLNRTSEIESGFPEPERYDNY